MHMKGLLSLPLPTVLIFRSGFTASRAADRQVTISLPMLKAGKQSEYMPHKPFSNDVDLSVIARRTPGFSGTDLENIINEGALLAGRGIKN